jgi:NADH-quinone oxidoreductase subunit G
VTIAAHQGPMPEVSHVVLPACAWAETDGTYVNRDGLAQASERALRPRGESQPGWLLVAKLGKALGFAMSWKKLSEVRRAMTPEPAPAAPAPSPEVSP